MTFDFTAMAFYAAVCGGLALVAPSASGWMMRAVIGSMVGVGGSAVLPASQVATGY